MMALEEHTAEVLQSFLLFTLGVIAFLTVYFVLLSISLVKFEIINPVEELIDHIKSPQDSEKITRFVKKIQKRVVHDEF